MSLLVAVLQALFRHCQSPVVLELPATAAACLLQAWRAGKMMESTSNQHLEDWHFCKYTTGLYESVE